MSAERLEAGKRSTGERRLFPAAHIDALLARTTGQLLARAWPFQCTHPHISWEMSAGSDLGAVQRCADSHSDPGTVPGPQRRLGPSPPSWWEATVIHSIRAR